MDKSLDSIRDLITRVNSRGKELDISTFSKASKKRETKIFERILNKAIKKLKSQKGKSEEKIYLPLDSIIITGRYLLGGERDNVEIRIVNFCSLENKTKYRLATNLSEAEFSNEEIGEIYRKRWAIETLWKFLKMHLKLNKLITKNDNGIQI